MRGSGRSPTIQYCSTFAISLANSVTSPPSCWCLCFLFMSTSPSYRDGGQHYLPAYYLAYALDDEGAAGRVVEPGRQDFLVFGRVVPALERRFVRRERLRRNRRDDAGGGAVAPVELERLYRACRLFAYMREIHGRPGSHRSGAQVPYDGHSRSPV